MPPSPQSEFVPDSGGSAKSVIIRGHRVGDLGIVVSRHGALYHQDYGFDITFEALVARIAADFIEAFDPKRCCSRIAEQAGTVVGSAFVVPADPAMPDLAKLRLVYLEPHMRGTGVARRMVEECLAFSHSAGYARMTLWTQDILVPARRLYASLGFTCVATNPFTGFGCTMQNEVWERAL